jgi:hypothetical protein
MSNYVVTERALLQRINRVLEKKNHKICKSRPGSRMESNCGRYYELDTYRNAVTMSNVDLKGYGADLNVLHPRETIAP